MAFPVTPLRIEVVATGNELLDGGVVDTNTNRLALAMQPLGFRILRTTVVPDSKEEIHRAVTDAVIRSDLVFISGGLGPTTDDITLEVVAKAFGSKLIEDAHAKMNVLRRLKAWGRKRPNRGHRKQFFIPDGATVLRNSQGTAPGIHWQLGDRDVFFLPGVPNEFELIVRTEILPILKKKFASAGSNSKEFLYLFKVFWKPESELNELMRKLKIASPKTKVGFRTKLPENHIKLLISANNERAAEKVVAPIRKMLKKKLGSALFSEGSMSFEEGVLDYLRKKKWTLALAESCTGGLTASMITKVSGSSAFFERGYITYSNLAKEQLLGVRAETLKSFGAVSQQTAIEMAEGARHRAQVDVAVAITGIAGPTGGTKAKPVGTIWIAASTKNATRTRLLQLPFSREMNQRFSAYAALQMIKDL